MYEFLQREVYDVDVGVAVLFPVLVKSVPKAHCEVSQFLNVREEVAGCEHLPVGNQLTTNERVGEQGRIVNHLDVVFRNLVLHDPVGSLWAYGGVGVASELKLRSKLDVLVRSRLPQLESIPRRWVCPLH